jgi:precorrin-6Y C5,15-methyltransferase (decarboxylating)
MAKVLKKIHILGVSTCFLDTAKKEILDLFADKKNRIDAVFAKKEDLGLLSWVKEQAALINKSINVENNGNITHLNNAAIFYDSKIKFITDYVKGNIGKKNILILAGGDPNFFGIGATLLGMLKENEKRFIEIYPAVSFIQAGFSKLKIPMTDALIISLHGRDFKNIFDALNSGKRTIGIYTDEVNTPHRIYSEMEEKGFLEEFEFYALTEICTKNEKIYKSFTKEILEDISSKKNIVVLNGKHKKNEDYKTFKEPHQETIAKTSGETESNRIVFGIDDDKYIHAAGEPTKKEIRSVSLGLMDLRADSVIIDAGCGSGSISIEASAVAWKGIVYSIDKNKNKIENLKKNIKKFGRQNIEPILGELPKALKHAVKAGQADSIFIGGGGGKNLSDILKDSLDILKNKGVIVINIVTIDSLSAVLAFISDYFSKDSKNIEIKYEIVSVNVARLKSVNEDSYFQALNQIYIVKITKTVKSANSERTEQLEKPEKIEKPASHRSRHHTFTIEHNNQGAAANGSGDKPNVKIRNKTIKTDNANGVGGGAAESRLSEEKPENIDKDGGENV